MEVKDHVIEATLISSAPVIRDAVKSLRD